jgi:hypothetical protein
MDGNVNIDCSKCKELRDALCGLLELIAQEKLVRNTRDDAHPNWALRQIPIALALAKAHMALESPTQATEISEARELSKESIDGGL